ncbi:hypothetical protein BCR34DRAFT_502175 [Clohesyomyces aquaticus]|uniref:Zn(2)-C6 fungal-type domain-containing protein n=1 Tax=Clohesyomyces aquaticus TaxID=1231657 RepID=A0A1Y1XW15_9PLEO|nr:hypothetical protein BCR34DRAFT_502175 [Clohesyomyces aquaticus]
MTTASFVPFQPLLSACNACRKRKVKCSHEEPCAPCVTAQISCEYAQDPRRGGNRGSRAVVLNELRRVQNQGSGVQNPSSSSETGPGGINCETGCIANVSVEKCIEAYLRKIQPTVPFLTRELLEKEARAQHSSPISRHFIVSFCAYVASFGCVFDGLDVGANALVPPTLAKVFLDAALRYHQPSRAAALTTRSVFISFFLYGAYAGVGNYRQGWYYLREATTLFLMCGKEDAQSPFTPAIRGQLFWILLVSERCAAHGIRRNRPITLQPGPDSPQLYSADDFGLQCLANLFFRFDETFFAIWNGSRPECTREWLLELERDVRIALPEVLDQLNSDQIANLKVSQFWLRIKLWELFPRFGYLASDSIYECLTFMYPVGVARELALVANNLPIESLQIHGVGLAEKVFDIACALADVLPFLPSQISRARGGLLPVDQLTQTATLLEKLPDGKTKFLPLLFTKLNDLPEVTGRLRETLQVPSSLSLSSSVYEDEVASSLYTHLRSVGGNVRESG